MRELPDEKTLDALIKIAKDFEHKAKDLYESATEVDEKWRVRLESKRQVTIHKSSRT